MQRQRQSRLGIGELTRRPRQSNEVNHAFELCSEARAGIGQWINYYNADRPHSALDGRTPAEAHQGVPARIGLAA